MILSCYVRLEVLIFTRSGDVHCFFFLGKKKMVTYIAAVVSGRHCVICRNRNKNNITKHCWIIRCLRVVRSCLICINSIQIYLFLHEFICHRIHNIALIIRPSPPVIRKWRYIFFSRMIELRIKTLDIFNRNSRGGNLKGIFFLFTLK